MKINSKIKKANILHKSGYNCSQCVAMVFSEITGLDDQTAAKVMAGFGGGVGGQAEICGAVSAMAMIEGFLREPGKETKLETYKQVKEISEEFIAENGSIICRELRGKSDENVGNTQIKKKPCMLYIEDAIRLVENRISSDK